MSDGRSFAKAQELSVEERILSLENKIPIYLERMQAYDKIIDKFKEIEVSVSSIASDQNQLLIKVDQQKKEQQQQINNMTARQDAYVSTANNMMAYAEKSKMQIEDQLRRLEESLVTHARSIDSVKKSMNESACKIASKQDIDLMNANHDGLKSSLQKRSDSISGAVDKVNSSLSQASERIEEINNSLFGEISIVKNWFNELRDQMSVDRFKIKSLDENTLPVVKREISSSIDKLKNELSQNAVNPSSIKEEIQKKMDLIELDGKNAVLRASNNEKHVDILKKQIENIYLLLKKHELSQ